LEQPRWRWLGLRSHGCCGIQKGFFIESSGAVFEAPAFIASFDDIAVMREPVEHGGCHFCMTKYLWPVCEGEIGCDDDRGVFVKLADQVEQELGTGLAKRQIAQFVDDDEVVAQQFFDDFSASSCGFFLLEAVDEVDEIEEAAAGFGPDDGGSDGDRSTSKKLSWPAFYLTQCSQIRGVRSICIRDG
jgi:hypothetical protein